MQRELRLAGLARRSLTAPCPALQHCSHPCPFGLLCARGSPRTPCPLRSGTAAGWRRAPTAPSPLLLAGGALRACAGGQAQPVAPADPKRFAVHTGTPALLPPLWVITHTNVSLPLLIPALVCTKKQVIRLKIIQWHCCPFRNWGKRDIHLPECFMRVR